MLSPWIAGRPGAEPGLGRVRRCARFRSGSRRCTRRAAHGVDSPSSICGPGDGPSGVVMSGWSEKLRQVLERGQGDFGIAEIRNPARLDDARQTGFVWTQQPGVVCLAANRAWFTQARDNPEVVAIIAPPAVAGRERADDKAVVVCEHRSDEHTSGLPSLMRISYAVFCLKTK